MNERLKTFEEKMQKTNWKSGQRTLQSVQDVQIQMC